MFPPNLIKPLLLIFFATAICACNFSDFDSATITNGGIMNDGGSGSNVRSNIFSRMKDFNTGYVELDVSFATWEQNEEIVITLRQKDDFNSYLCILGDLESATGDLEAYAAAVVDNEFVGYTAATSTYAITDSNKTLKFGCEITSDGKLHVYVDRKLLATYVLGSASGDTILPAGKIGLVIVDGNDQDISINHFSVYTKFGF